MKRASALVLVLILGVTVPRAAAPTIAIDASTLAGKVSPLFRGAKRRHPTCAPAIGYLAAISMTATVYGSRSMVRSGRYSIVRSTGSIRSSCSSDALSCRPAVIV
jgi:hypothetical protein